MRRSSILCLAIACLAFVAFGLPANTLASGEYRISGPFAHDNLAIYFVHGPSQLGPIPLTLQEAMAKGAARIHETGSVNQLELENLSDDEIFVQSGDIVKGGQQDRVLTVSLLLPPHSGRISIAAFCVEQGRWSARGKEDVKTFSSAAAAVPSRHAKIAMKAPPAPSPAPSFDTTGARQMEVWKDVEGVQRKLSSNVGSPVAAPQSQTSLQLALENEKLKEAQAAYVKALQSAGEMKADIIGYVFAINGKLNSADIYPSNGLFLKMWPKLLAANATEAISEKSAETSGALPSTSEVMAFLDTAERGPVSKKTLTDTVRLQTHDGGNAYLFETSRVSGAFVHRNYLAK